MKSLNILGTMRTFVPKGNLRGFIMPDFIFQHKKLSLGAKMLYALLCDYAGTKDHCWPAHKTLADRLNCSVSSIKTYLKQLIEHKFIQDAISNSVRSSVYYLLQSESITLSIAKNKSNLSLSSCSQNLTTPQSKIGYKPNLNEYKTNTPLPPSNDGAKSKSYFVSRNQKRGVGSFACNNDFEEFYKLYPRKEGKELARSVWSSLHRSGSLPSLNTIVQAIQKAQASYTWQKEYGRFIPIPANYLRGQRWNDIPFDLERQNPINNTVSNPEPPRPEILNFIKNQEQKACKEKQITESLRPLFERIAIKFNACSNSLAFGLWKYLHNKGIAPTEQDLPVCIENIELTSWLQEYKASKVGILCQV